MGERERKPAGGSHPWRASRGGIGLVGGMALVLAMLIGLGLALVFAATLALAMAFATVTLGLTALAWRMRRPALREARVARVRAGHAWVGYDWDGRHR